MYKIKYFLFTALLFLTLFSTKAKAGESVVLEIKPRNTNTAIVNNKLLLDLVMAGNTSVNVNSLMISIFVPKGLSVTDLIYQLNTSFDFNHFKATPIDTGTRVEIMFIKLNNNSFLLNPNDKIITFEVSSTDPATYQIQPTEGFGTSILDTEGKELFGSFTPNFTTVEYVLTTPSPTPTSTPTPTTSPIPTPTPIPSSTPTVTPTPTPSPSAGATLLIEGNKNTFINEVANFDIKFSSTLSGVVGVDAVLLFDPTKINIEKVTENSLLSNTSFVNINNTLGIVKISQVSPAGQAFKGEGILATLSVKPVAQGGTTISFDYTLGATNDSNAVSENGVDLLIKPNDFNLSINNHAYLRIKLSTPSSQGFVVEGLVSYTNVWSSIFTTSAEGISDVMQITDALFNQTIDLVIKVPGFLGKRKNIVVKGENIIDLGELKAGDINNDGIINSLDLTLMYEVWGNKNVIADYNKDNVVNTFDYYILTKNFYAENE